MRTATHEDVGSRDARLLDKVVDGTAAVLLVLVPLGACERREREGQLEVPVEAEEDARTVDVLQGGARGV